MVVRSTPPGKKAVALAAALAVAALAAFLFRSPIAQLIGTASLSRFGTGGAFSAKGTAVLALSGGMSGAGALQPHASEVDPPQASQNSTGSAASSESDTGSSGESSETASGQPVFFESKSVNLYPTSQSDCSVYGRVFLRQKNVDIRKKLSADCGLENGGGKVLILCTHSTESYSMNTEQYATNGLYSAKGGVVSVAAELAKTLNACGIAAVTDFTAFDSPVFSGAFERSGKMIAEAVGNDPDIKLVIDLHRDYLVEENLTGLRTVAPYGGAAAAQIMMLAPGGGDSLLFALKLQRLLEAECPTLTRPVELPDGDYGYSGAARLVICVGTQSNTLGEALVSARLIASAAASLLGA